MRREQRRYRPLIWFAIKLCPIYSFDDGRKGGEEASRIEDELSLSCHLVLRRNWNGVRSTITLAFARDRVSGVRKHIHTYVVRTRIHARIIAGFFPTRTDSGDCEVVACLESLAYIYMKTRQYDTYFAARLLLSSPPSLFEASTPFTCHFGPLLEKEYKRENRRTRQRKVKLWR